MADRTATYRLIERVSSRRVLWKLGRFLYQGARRELRNDPATNGEYALIDQMLAWHGRHHAGETATLIDVGANFCDWSVRAIEIASARACPIRVHAFEPAPAQAKRAAGALRQAGNGAETELHEAAVGEAEGTARFVVTGAASGNSALAGDRMSFDGEVIDVPVTTLDTFIAAQRFADILLVKVDTEGHDLGVIKGARSLLAEGRIAALQFEYNWRWVDQNRLLRHAYALVEGTQYQVAKLSGDAIELYPDWHPELERFFETNFVLIRHDVLADLPHARLRFGSDNTPREY